MPQDGGLCRRLAPQGIPHYVSEDPNDKKDRGLFPLIPTIVSRSTILGIARLWLQRVRSSHIVWSLLIFIALFIMHCVQNINILSHVAPSGFRKRPIMVQMISDNTTVVKQLPLQAKHWIQDRRNHYWLDHGASFHRQIKELDPDCMSLGDWQEERNNMNCNSFHEIDLTDIHWAGKGGLLVVWAFQEYDGTRRALKMLRYTKDSDFNHVNYEGHRRDAMALAQLSASPYVARFYGFCSHSSVAHYSDEGTLWKIFDNDYKPTKEKLFRIAYDVACGVRDAHHLNDKGRPTIAHMDIKANQFILIDGVYKLNDFNLCHFLTWNKTANEYCGFVNGYTGRVSRKYELASLWCAH